MTGLMVFTVVDGLRIAKLRAVDFGGASLPVITIRIDDSRKSTQNRY
jgi:hypothetical protein